MTTLPRLVAWRSILAGMGLLVPAGIGLPSAQARRTRLLSAHGVEWTASCDSARGGVDQPFDEAIILDKLAQNTHDTFPSMATELAAVVTGDHRADARSWRAAVATMLQGGAS